MTPKQANNLQPNGWSLLSLFLLSAVIISIQLVLMRSLSLLRYHHFSYLVISTALLGFGASGTFLTFFYQPLVKNILYWISVFFLCLVISIPVSYYLANQLPIDTQYVLYSTQQQFYTLLYNFLLFLPFFFGAVLIGLQLTYFKKQGNLLYGANLAGSGLGALLALWIMYLYPASELPLKITVLALPAYFCWLLAFPKYYFQQVKKLTFIKSSIVILGVAGLFFIKYQPEVDAYKSLSHLEDLRKQGDAEKIITQFGPRAQIDVYQSKKIHNTLFAGLQGGVMPPPQLSLIMDGQEAGTIFSIDSMENAAIMDFTPQSIPYRLSDKPKVLLLGEAGGSNTWMAKRYGAKSITVVQTNPQVVNLMQDELKNLNGQIFKGSEIQVINKSPRLFLEQTREKFDIIQFVTAEGMPASAGGLQSLHEDFLLTTDAFRHARSLLTPNGFLSLTRGIQTPPRDNIKIMATLIEALREEGIENPGDYLLQSRNYLAVNTLLSRTPVSRTMLKKYKASNDSLGHDMDYFPGITPDSLTQNNSLPNPLTGGGAPGNDFNQSSSAVSDSISYFYFATQHLLGKDPEKFYQNWIYNVRPPSDNKPYFHNFFKWTSIENFRDTYGRFWLQRLELGYVVLIITLAEVTILGLLLILLPLFFLKGDLKNTSNKLPVFLHFGGIGMGFMFLEMVFMQKFTQFLGDPIYSIAAAMTAILIFAGLGSSIQKKLGWLPQLRIRIATIALILVTILFLLFLDPILDQLIDLSLTLRYLFTILFLFPVSFLLGWFFPSGLQLLEDQENALIPWAWGINGFTSVAAAPLAVMLAMSNGFSFVIIMALIFYTVVGATSYLWKLK